jgi:hypothetical protein
MMVKRDPRLADSCLLRLAVKRRLLRRDHGEAARPIQPIAWRPLPGPQSVGSYCPADILFYGGAAGGGKSEMLLGLALTAHRKSIIFRREFPQLKELEERSRELIGGRGRYNGHEKTWRFDDGRLLEFGAVKQEAFVQKYQGRPHDLIGFDEVAHFLEAQFRFLIG